MSVFGSNLTPLSDSGLGSITTGQGYTDPGTSIHNNQVWTVDIIFDDELDSSANHTGGGSSTNTSSNGISINTGGNQSMPVEQVPSVVEGQAHTTNLITNLATNPALIPNIQTTLQSNPTTNAGSVATGNPPAGGGGNINTGPGTLPGAGAGNVGVTTSGPAGGSANGGGVTVIAGGSANANGANGTTTGASGNANGGNASASGGVVTTGPGGASSTTVNGGTNVNGGGSAPRGGKNIVQGIGQAFIDAGMDVAAAVELASDLLTDPATLENFGNSIQAISEALQDPARRAEAIELIGSALGQGIVDAVENFANDPDYSTGYIVGTVAAGLVGGAGAAKVIGKLDGIAAKIGATFGGGKNVWNIPKNVTDKIPSDWGVGIPNKKGVGTRWKDPNNPNNGARIDQGNPNHTLPSQQVDHVIINRNGKVIGRDGKPINGSIKDNATQAHIPLSEYKNWKKWDSPL